MIDAIFGKALAIIGGFLAFGAFLLVMFIIGVATHKGSTGMTAVGYGIGELFALGIELIKGIFTGLASAAKSI